MFGNFLEETATGTGATLALAGATTGNIQFQEKFADGDLVEYVVDDSGGTIKVGGTGIYVSATDDITRNDTWNWNGTTYDDNPTTNITLSGGTHTVRCDALSGSVEFPFKPESGEEYYSADDILSNNQNTVLAADTVYTMPFRVKFAGEYDGTRLYIPSTGTATKMRIALFSVDADKTLGSLIVETGDISVTTGNEKISAITASNLEKGYYYLAYIADGTVTIAANNANLAPKQGFWGNINGFASRVALTATQTVSSGWTTFPSITTVGTKSETNGAAIALVGV